ncbi:nucleotidyltransferase domain-containing protein [Candidatus Woesearchaeota archaeon]|nr:nucleotidyltransferase domain-containing protein [Candidatus Woesearchaeota archaeon]
MNITKIKQRLLALDTKKAIQFIVLFGSVATGKNNKLSDIDIAIYYDDNKKERFAFRMKALGEFSDKVDLEAFEKEVKKFSSAGNPDNKELIT